MLNKLRTRVVLLILGGAISSIILVSIITNTTLFNKFNIYMRNQQENSKEEIVRLVEQSYSLNKGWTIQALRNISVSPLIAEVDIEIRDNNNNLIFRKYMENKTIQMHHDMMGRMGYGMMRNMDYGMMRNNLRDENYYVEDQELIVDNKEIGTITIGHVGPFFISERDVEFTKGINISIIKGAIISALVAIFLGIFSSKFFSRPITQITEAANNIRKGKLDTKVNVSSNIVELQELSKSINHLSKSLNEQEVLRKRLTSDISHELRTPLTILQSHIEAISDGIWEPTQDKLDICKNEVVRLIRLVEELKYLTDIENHKVTLNIQQYSLTKDMMDLIEGFNYQFDETGIKIIKNIQEDVNIYGDKDKIKQVLINLLSNALKFTSGQSEGTIIVGLLKHKSNVNITVEDTGSGIDERDIPYIFERFYRGDISRNRKTGGAGIGLTIAKTYIEAHGGKIMVESKKNLGTKFTIELPINNKVVNRDINQ